jgi:hypothetical protein
MQLATQGDLWERLNWRHYCLETIIETARVDKDRAGGVLLKLVGDSKSPRRFERVDRRQRQSRPWLKILALKPGEPRVVLGDLSL